MILDTSPYFFNNTNQINSPSILVYPNIIGDNIDNALKLISGENSFLCPHVKTVKSKEPLNMAIQRGIRNFKCSTMAEAKLLGMVGAEHALICYQVTEDKMESFAAIKSQYLGTKFTTLVDNIDSAKMLSDHFNGTPVQVFIDVDVGMHRTGLSFNKVPELVKKIKQLKDVIVTGLHAYDGHVHESDRKIRKNKTDVIFQKLLELKNSIEVILYRKLILILGGSPSFPYYAKKSNVLCSPGTFFLWDYGYGKKFPELPFKPAAIILTRIISKPTSETLCFDLGYKAVASDPPQPRISFIDIPEYHILAQYEEHLVISVPDAAKYNIGEAYFAIPYHICPTINLYDKLAVIENKEFNGFWEIPARNRTITI